MFYNIKMWRTFMMFHHLDVSLFLHTIHYLVLALHCLVAGVWRLLEARVLYFGPRLQPSFFWLTLIRDTRLTKDYGFLKARGLIKNWGLNEAWCLIKAPSNARALTAASAILDHPWPFSRWNSRSLRPSIRILAPQDEKKRCRETGSQTIFSRSISTDRLLLTPPGSFNMVLGPVH